MKRIILHITKRGEHHYVDVTTPEQQKIVVDKLWKLSPTIESTVRHQIRANKSEVKMSTEALIWLNRKTKVPKACKFLKYSLHRDLSRSSQEVRTLGEDRKLLKLALKGNLEARFALLIKYSGACDWRFRFVVARDPRFEPLFSQDGA